MTTERQITREKAKHDALGLTPETLVEMYYKMLLARTISERVWILNRQGRAVFAVSCDGHEGCQVGSTYAIRRGRDFVVPYYRDMAVAISLGQTARDIMLHMLSRAADPSSGGRQMPGHFGSSRLRLFSGSSPVGTQITHAAGVALATKIKKENDVTIVYFGDGASSTADFHGGLNFAGVHRLPVVFFCENNGYAISVPLHKQMALKNVADRAKAYGFPGVVVDGNDILAVYEVTREAVERARRGEGPTLIEAKTYRFSPHTSNDDDRRYRTREEVDEHRKQDPIPRFKGYLIGEGILTEKQDIDLRAKVIAEVDDAVAFSERNPDPDPSTLTLNLYGS